MYCKGSCVWLLSSILHTRYVRVLIWFSNEKDFKAKQKRNALRAKIKCEGPNERRCRLRKQLSIWFPSLSRCRRALLSIWESEEKSPTERLRIIFSDESTVSRGSVEHSDLPMKDICGFHYANPAQNEHGLHLYAVMERQGRMAGYGDGSDRVALSLTPRETHNACYMGGGPWLTHIFTAGPVSLGWHRCHRVTFLPSFKWAFCPFKLMLDSYRPFFLFFSSRLSLFVIVTWLTPESVKWWAVFSCI